MPRHPRPNTTRLSTYEELRNLRLAVAVRSEQVKLRRLEWDTQKIALPHITPMPGDGELQVRKPLTRGDLPAPRPPAKRPEYKDGMPDAVYCIMLDVYRQQLRDEWDRNPYNKLASMSAQKKWEEQRDKKSGA